LNYKKFLIKAQRSDVAENDAAHFFSRNFAGSFAYFFYKLNATPNMVTFLFLIVGICTSLALNLSMPILAYICWRLHIIIDMADGSLARATQTFSKSAVGFDRSNHIIINTCLFIVTNQHLDNQLIVGILIISFYLYYFFSRNYFSEKQSTRKFTIGEVLIKNALGLEGYVLTVGLILFFELPELQLYVALFYSLTFFTLYFLKLRVFIKSQV
jgi:phosphatidylglycerophosphate synthase